MGHYGLGQIIDAGRTSPVQVHWAACIYYHMAEMHGDFGPDTWVGRNPQYFVGKPIITKYLVSLYFSVSTFTVMGDATLYPETIAELIFTILYLFFILFLGAYIIGTVTIMMVQADQRSSTFRDSIEHLNEYSAGNNLPDVSCSGTVFW